MWWHTPVTPAREGLKQGNLKFRASLGCEARLCLLRQNTKHKTQNCLYTITGSVKMEIAGLYINSDGSSH